MKHWLHPAAEAELTRAANYYAQAASTRVAQALLVEFERVVGLLEINQQLGTPARDGLRIFPLRRFPFSVVYRESQDGPKVYAVAHQRREPIYWKNRV